jgi:DNA recombination protein RmuC
MGMQNSILFIIAAFVVGVIITWIFLKLIFAKNHVAKQEFEGLDKRLQSLSLEKGILDAGYAELKSKEEKVQSELNGKLNELNHANKAIAGLTAAIEFKQEKLDTQTQEIENIGKKFETEFKLLAGRILDEKTVKFNELQETSLKGILDPLKENIKDFKKEFGDKINKESEERISLREQIKHMMDLNRTLSTQADNLTKALSNNVKQQGDWGEEILESILEYAGLQKDIQYFVQQQSQNHDGTTIRPDIIVKYPDGRSLVIDSKVSLVHHSRYCAAETAEEQALQLRQLVNSLKQHIDGLSRKDYQAVTDALDFIMMFVPNEAAYITSMQVEHELWQYAYKKRVMLISPTNLIPAMKLVADMWQKDAIGKNALEIADRAGKLYDKLAGFVENFEKIGGQIEKANNTWIDAQRQLHKGKGNLLSQAEQMKRLQVKTNKKLPEALIQEALLEDGIDTNETTENGQ